MLGTLKRLPESIGRKAWTTSSQYGPYTQGCTRATMATTEGSETARFSKSVKSRLSSDWSLQLDSMKSESLVKAYQLRRLEYVPGPCTHRPSHHGSLVHPKPSYQLLAEEDVEGVPGNWDEVVTR